MLDPKSSIENFSYDINSTGEYRDTWKVFRIMAELVEGYQFLSKFDRQATVFGSARTNPKDKYYAIARELGRLLVKDGYTVVTGGGPGIMEAANRGATEAGGESLGLNIQLSTEQRVNRWVKKSVAFYYFFTRKVMLTAPSHANIVFPGGYGTMDELFEILDSMELGFMSKTPVILVGKEYWNPLLKFLKQNAFQKVHALEKNDFSLVHVVDTAQEAVLYLKKRGVEKIACELSPYNFHCNSHVNWRIFLIMAEVVGGFEFLTGLVEDVTILGTKSIKKNSRYFHSARSLGKRLAQEKFSVVTGGFSGVAEAANQGAFEAGGDSIGIYTRREGNGKPNPYLTRSISFQFSYIRKLILTSPSKAFVLFPGGFGTLDQCFEVLTLLQTGKMSPVPVILFDRDYFAPLVKFVREDLYGEYRTISDRDMNLFHVVDTVEEAMDIILQARDVRREGKKSLFSKNINPSSIKFKAPSSK